MKTVAPHTPVQYIIGKAEFCGLDILVDERVLIPRPETETLVQAVMELIAGRYSNTGDLAILDLCTGSGNIAISLAREVLTRPASTGIDPEPAEGLTKDGRNCTIVASDISPDALELARLNAAANGVAGRIDFIQSDLFGSIDSRFDIIVSNPPYIARHEFAALQPEVLREPRIALDGGEDGLDYYRHILAGCGEHLRRGGCVAMEIGYGQRRRIARIIEEAGSLELAEVKPDRAGIERVIVAVWKN
jgi:release factor glutamine methyltransferase